MQKIRINPKLTLVFGLDWAQLDPLERKLRHQIVQWKEEGYKYAAQYAHPGGQVFGLFRPSDEIARFDKTCMSGAAVVATHPSLADKTAIVLIEFVEPGTGDEPDATKVIFVGVRDGKVLMDYIIDPSEIAEQRNRFRSLHAVGQDVLTFGELSGDYRVDHAFSLAQLTPSKGGGKACPVVELRNSYGGVFVWIGLALVLAGIVGYFVWQAQLDAAAEMRRRIALKENSPQALYTKEIARWSARQVNMVSPSVEFLRDKLSAIKFQVARAGWNVVNISCLGEQCTSRWKREYGTLDEFRAAAPPEWKVINATDQENIDVAMDFKLPTSQIDRAAWPQLPALRDKLISHWQYLYPLGWRATLGDMKQLAIPVGFNDEQKRAIAAFPNAPRGVEINVSEQAWLWADPDVKAPLRAENFTDQVELIEPLVVKYDGKQILFNFKGIIYVSTN